MKFMAGDDVSAVDAAAAAVTANIDRKECKSPLEIAARVAIFSLVSAAPRRIN
jgi:hypothetical protein